MAHPRQYQLSHLATQRYILILWTIVEPRRADLQVSVSTAVLHAGVSEVSLQVCCPFFPPLCKRCVLAAAVRRAHDLLAHDNGDRSSVPREKHGFSEWRWDIQWDFSGAIAFLGSIIKTMIADSNTATSCLRQNCKEFQALCEGQGRHDTFHSVGRRLADMDSPSPRQKGGARGGVCMWEGSAYAPRGRNEVLGGVRTPKDTPTSAPQGVPWIASRGWDGKSSHFGC
eukprot:5596653-Pyramimonas_sp.AAC.1